MGLPRPLIYYIFSCASPVILCTDGLSIHLCVANLRSRIMIYPMLLTGTDIREFSSLKSSEYTVEGLFSSPIWVIVNKSLDPIVCVILYLLFRCMRPYWIMAAAGFSYMTLSRPGPALPILASTSCKYLGPKRVSVEKACWKIQSTV